MGGPKWSILVNAKQGWLSDVSTEGVESREPRLEPASSSKTAQMPAPAPMSSVPFMSAEAGDLHTRIVMLGSLARCHERTRNFWHSAWTNTACSDDSTVKGAIAAPIKGAIAAPTKGAIAAPTLTVPEL